MSLSAISPQMQDKCLSEKSQGNGESLQNKPLKKSDKENQENCCMVFIKD